MFKVLFTRPGPYSRRAHGWFAVLFLSLVLVYGYALLVDFLPSILYIIAGEHLGLFLRFGAFLYLLFGSLLLAILVLGSLSFGWIALIVMRPKNTFAERRGQK